LLNADYVGL